MDSGFIDISCPAAGFCVATSFADPPRAHVWVHDHWLSRGDARVMPMRATYQSISCPTKRRCFAAGNEGQKTVIARWNGRRWRQIPAP